MGIKTTESNDLDKFYSKYFYFSYSGLNKLLFSPSLFYSWYIKREREDSIESHFVEGRLIHCLILEADKFDEQFAIMTGDLPGVTNKKITEAVHRLWQSSKDNKAGLSNYGQEILDWLVSNNTHQSLKDDKDLTKLDAKTGDEKRLAKVLTLKSKNYFNYLKASEDKTVIDQSTFDKCEEAAIIVAGDEKINNLLKFNTENSSSLEIHNEIMLSCKLGKYDFGLRGIIDNYVVDHANKKIFINDLKTTSKGLGQFKDSLDYYKYWLQAAIYVVLVRANNPELKDYEVVFHFIVVDNHNNVYPFPVSVESLQNWQNQLKEVLETAKYHYNKKEYKLPYDFATGNVVL